MGGCHCGGKENGYQRDVREPLDDAQRARFDTQYVLDIETRADKPGTGKPEHQSNSGGGGYEMR